MNDHCYMIVLAGGRGERLWPLSRENRPKQLLPFGQSKSLLSCTLERIHSLVKKENRWVVTTKQQEEAVVEQVHGVVGHVVVEPITRNTAAAILLACLELYQRDPDAVAVFLPADHFIKEQSKFCAAIEQAVNVVLQREGIVLLGLKPTYPATGYGYIEYRDGSPQEVAYPVIRFHEKPSQKTADFYINIPTMLWNSGIFCARVTTFLDEFRKHGAALFAQMDNYRQGSIDYAALSAISFDQEILEKSTIAFVVPVDFVWSDVGNLETFILLEQQQLLPDNVITLHAQRNVVYAPHKLVALVDVEDLCIVETEDVLFIGRRAQTDKVKQIVALLRNNNKRSYL